MGGIFGRYNYSEDYSESIKNELGRWNKPYGNDGSFEWHNNSLFVGCCYDRIKSTENEWTFEGSRENYVGVFDVLLFNREELDGSLKKNDEDLLFSYVTENGFDALKNVNGDFAGAIYSESESKLTLFRDHMGVRPLYYICCDNYFAFSTDIRGICGMSDYEPQISEEWIYNTLIGYPNFGTENTAYSNVHCVPPGGYLTVDLKTKTIEKKYYWRVGTKKVRYKKDSEYIAKMRELIEDSVKRRLAVCDDPIGAELSGGLDSGVIDILISRNKRKGVYVSWSATPEEIPYVEGDERYVIGDICKQENIECIFTHRSVSLDRGSRTVECLKELGAYDEDCSLYAIKYALPPFSNTLTVTEGSEILKSHGTKVVFTGHGGDEGVSHRATAFEMIHFHEYSHFLNYMWTQTKGKKLRFLRTVKRVFGEYGKYLRRKNNAFVSPWATPQLMNKEFAKKEKGLKGGSLSFGYDPIDYIRGGGSRSRLDNIAMQGSFAGVKYLIPFLDYRVVDYAVSIPRYMYLRGNQNRYIYREAFKDILPDSLYQQKMKRTASLASEGNTDGWFAYFCKRREYVYNRLNKDLWNRYLDYDYIDEWMTTGEPAKEDLQKNEAIYATMFNCLLIQNMLEKSKIYK